MNYIKNNLCKFRQVNVLVIGDIMLDRFTYGRVERISPEAPVPVFNYCYENQMLGGAGNVVANISSLGAKCTFLGIIGKDHAGLKISSLLGKLRVHSHLLKLSEYPTIQKTRIIAGNYHLLRIDHEIKLPTISNIVDRFSKIIQIAIQKSDVILLSLIPS